MVGASEVDVVVDASVVVVNSSVEGVVVDGSFVFVGASFVDVVVGASFVDVVVGASFVDVVVGAHEIFFSLGVSVEDVLVWASDKDIGYCVSLRCVWWKMIIFKEKKKKGTIFYTFLLKIEREREIVFNDLMIDSIQQNKKSFLLAGLIIIMIKLNVILFSSSSSFER